jgi:hypothetical protein
MDEELVEPSHSTAEMSRLETEVKRTEFENVDGLLPTQAVTDSMDAGALAKEQTLRELVLQSRKRKLVQAGSNQQPTSTTAPTATSGHPLEQLAVNFIADAISRPPAAKRVKVTPSPTAMIAWGKRLEQHIESSKGIMAKIHSAPTRMEKNRLMEILREKDRCVSRWHMLDFACFKWLRWTILRPHSRLESEKMALFSYPVEEPLPVSPWPDSHPDNGVLELSDTEDESYDSDNEMEE